MKKRASSGSNSSGSESDVEMKDEMAKEMIQPKKSGGGFFGMIGSMFGGSSAQASNIAGGQLSSSHVQPQQKIQMQSQQVNVHRSKMNDNLSANLYQAQKNSKQMWSKK